MQAREHGGHPSCTRVAFSAVEHLKGLLSESVEGVVDCMHDPLVLLLREQVVVVHFQAVQALSGEPAQKRCIYGRCSAFSLSLAPVLFWVESR
jgi:hypothetical protein